MRNVLEPVVDRNWEVAAGTLAWSCRDTAAHIAHDLAAYAAQLAGRVRDSYLRFDLGVAADAQPAEILRVTLACGHLLGAAVAAADAEARAWHWGLADASGFAAMGVGEILVHTYDIAQGLGLRWEPPTDLAEAVVERLLPDAPRGDANAVLLWATGRQDLPGCGAVMEWVWHAAVNA